MNLINSLGRRGVDLGLFTKKVDILDTDYLSKYFQISEFNPKFTPGKNSISFNGSELLKDKSEIQIQCNDAAGNSLFVELAEGDDIIYKESSAFVVSVHVYGDTVEGAGKVALVGTTLTNKVVKWETDITIDKSIYNTSKVRFYSPPTIEVNPKLVPMISNTLSSTLTKVVVLTGSFYTVAASPKKDTTKLSINRNTVDIDYRLISDDVYPNHPSASINSQIEGFDADLYIRKIKKPFSYGELSVNQTQSIRVSDVINNKSFKLDEAFYYKDNNNNRILAEVSDGTYSIQYPYVSYNTQSTAFQSIGSGPTLTNLYFSYAEIIYRNLQPFSGYISRHKLYRRSLYSAGDFEVIADEPLSSKELLLDNITLNKSFDKLGSFYNQYHINRYWFTQPACQLVHQSSSVIDSMLINASSYSIMDGSIYVILKNDSSTLNRNDLYLPFDDNEFQSESGSSYDCNFIELKKQVQYILSTGMVVYKNRNQQARVDFYFTSSVTDIRKEPGFSPTYGAKIGEVSINDVVDTKYFHDSIKLLYSPQNDLFGTIVIVPVNCFLLLSDLSFKPYGDDGFSPDILVTRIPFPISIANESFEIKAELFDINSNLVYSDLRTIQFFDPTGSSLNSYMPGYSQAGDSQVPGDLVVSGSLSVIQNVFISGSLLDIGDLVTCPSPPYVIGYNADGTICKTSPGGGSGNASYDSDYIYIDIGGGLTAVQVSLTGGDTRITAI